jgi:hypothetical protein
MYLMARTRLGKWSVRLIIAFLLCFVLFTLIAALGQKGGATLMDNLLLAIPGFATAVCAIGAFVTGIIAVFHRGEAAVLVYVSMAVGLAVTLFVSGEILFSH